MVKSGERRVAKDGGNDLVLDTGDQQDGRVWLTEGLSAESPTPLAGAIVGCDARTFVAIRLPTRRYLVR